MEEKEKSIQRALGLIIKYLVKVENISKKDINIVVEAVSKEKAIAIAMLKLNSRQRRGVRKHKYHGISAHEYKLWTITLDMKPTKEIKVYKIDMS